MRGKGIGYLLIALVFFYGVAGIVNALPISVSFSGEGVTVSLTFPGEAHPADSIWHNVTLIASTETILQNFTVIIKAPVNSSWVEIFNASDTSQQLLPRYYNFNISLPQETNGTLQCFIYVDTSSIDDLSSMLFTTRVNTLTFDEMLLLYNEMLTNYTQLQANYTALMNEYNGLLADYSTLLANYTALLSEHNELMTEYNAQVASYESLDSKYKVLQSEVSSLSSSLNTKSSEYNSLQTNFGSLNSTFSSLQGNYTALEGNYTLLEGFYNALNDAKTQLEADYSDLQASLTVNRVVMFILVMIVAGVIALIIYIRRRESEPYVIIRKETVAVKPDKES